MRRVLEVDGLVKVYGRPGAETLSKTGAARGSNICPDTGAVAALNQVSLTLDEGEILGIMGESGSGKSTLLKILYMEERADSGSALFFDDPAGQPLRLFDLNPAEARRLRDQRFGMVRQNPRLELNFEISAGGNVAERLLVAGPKHFGRVRERAVSLLERTEVPVARVDERPGGFSGGMQQRVQIARALATQPALLFLDEVTTSLDLSVQARILDLILELHQRLKLSMIVVSHDLGVVRTLASRTLIMKDGCIVEAGVTDQILEDPQHPYTQQLVSSAL